MKICVVDLETTGLDLKTDHITEIGFVIWDTEAKRILASFSALSAIPQDKTIPDDIALMTGITTKMNHETGAEVKDALEMLVQAGEIMDFFVAHNAANMEIPWLAYHCEQNELEFPKVKWIDTSVDIPFHPWIKTRKLTHLAADHAVPLRGAHGALEDCLTTIEILKKYDFSEIARRSQEPNVELVVADGFNNKDKARERGFRYSGPPDKKWSKIVKQSEVDSEIEKCDFKVIPFPKIKAQ